MRNGAHLTVFQTRANRANALQTHVLIPGGRDDDCCAWVTLAIAVVGIDQQHARPHDGSDCLEVFGSGRLIGVEELAAMSG